MDTGPTMGSMRLLATVAGPYGNCRPCVECGYQPAIGERIYGDVETANIYCERCAQIDGEAGA